jgi:hypothetical protein
MINRALASTVDQIALLITHHQRKPGRSGWDTKPT